MLRYKYRQIEDVIIDKISDLKYEMRYVIQQMLKIIHRSHTRDFYQKMLIKLNNCSIIGKEEILRFFMETSVIGNDGDL
jgi:hypothetical protein